ncbi:lamin tail domain-containing protein, partial [bacterium]|nr:lamin tail domain-containing protein [bacterium]
MKRLFTTLIVLSMAFTLVWAQNDLNLAFEDDGDVANWGVHGETNVWTAVAWDATAGVDGTGGIIFTDAGWDFLIKRPVAATLGAHFSLTVDVKNENFTGQTLYLKVEGLGTVEPEVALASESPDFISYTVSGIADIATDGYIRLYGAGGAEAKTVTIDNLVYNDDVPAVFFSEYIEGSSYNKALEIYNGSDEAVDLTAFAFPNVSNDPTVVGEYEYWNTFPEGASVAPGDVYVIAHGSADAAMLAEADFTFNFLSNGDDGFALVQGTEADFTVIDWIGDWNGDPGDGWDVAGVTEATKDHTLIRKADVMIGHTDWATSAGTDADNSEWIVMDQDFWGNLGDHPYAPMGMVTFSVDMSFQTELGFFIPGTDFLDVAGTLNDWGGGDVLTDDNADGIYEGTFEVATGAMEYKYRINGNWDTSENLPANRMWDVVDGANVIPTVWYSDQEPVVAVNVEVFIQVDMTVQLLNGNYDPGAGDLIVIRGGHDNFGNWGGAVEMLLDPEQTNIYTHLSA